MRGVVGLDVLCMSAQILPAIITRATMPARIRMMFRAGFLTEEATAGGAVESDGVVGAGALETGMVVTGVAVG
jgi:hypothetical protein